MDFPEVSDRESFAKGILWMAQTVQQINNGILKDMHEFDGAEMAEGVRIAIGKQNKALAATENFVKAFLDET